MDHPLAARQAASQLRVVHVGGAQQTSYCTSVTRHLSGHGFYPITPEPLRPHRPWLSASHRPSRAWVRLALFPRDSVTTASTPGRSQSRGGAVSIAGRWVSANPTMRFNSSLSAANSPDWCLARCSPCRQTHATGAGASRTPPAGVPATQSYTITCGMPIYGVPRPPAMPAPLATGHRTGAWLRCAGRWRGYIRPG